MTHLLRRALALTALLGGSLAAAPAAVASAAPALPTITVTSHGSSFTVSGPSQRRPGRVRFHFVDRSPAGSDGSDVTLFKLLPGTTLPQVYASIRAQNVETPTPAALAAAARSTRTLLRQVHLFGGAALSPGTTADVTETLYTGTYLLLDTNAALEGRSPQLRTIRVRGRAYRTAAPSAGARIDLTSADRFVAPATLRAGGTYLVRNVSDTIHFATFSRVKPGTTDAQVSAFFRAIMTGANPGPAPFTGPSVQMNVLSPGTQALFSSASLPRGTYDLECFISDDETGVPHAFMGMHRIVRVV